MIRLLQDDGVRFPNNQTLKFATLDPIEGDILHAEGDWEDAVGATSDRDTPSVVVVFGPQHGPVTAMQVEQCLRAAYRFGYDDLVFAGFSFDGAAQATIQDDLNPNVRIHIAHINPDVAMGDLLKETPSTQLFTVFGMPRTKLEETRKRRIHRQDGGCRHLQSCRQHSEFRRCRQGRSMVRRFRLRRSHLLHHPSLLSRQVCMGQNRPRPQRCHRRRPV